MTLAELIVELTKLDSTLPVAIEDADTGWCAPVIQVSVKGLEEDGSLYAVMEPCCYADMKGYFK